MTSQEFSEKIYKMSNGERIYFVNFPMVYRVPGGWVFTDEHIQGAVFVPWHNEFQPVKE
jgi:hypothetical protein